MGEDVWGPMFVLLVGCNEDGELVPVLVPEEMLPADRPTQSRVIAGYTPGDN